jgi:hypothetical protein
MIAYDLRCASAHIFEGWFASSTAYDDQQSRGLICCPVCGDTSIAKVPTAPFIGRKSNQSAQAAPTETPAAASNGANPVSLPNDKPKAKAKANIPVSNTPMNPEAMKQLIDTLAKAQTEALKSSEWVGRKFADEARAIHYGETQARQIHGEASIKEAQALEEEGVSIAALPIPLIPPEAKN